MLPWDPNGKIGPKKPLPDHVNIVEPKEERDPQAAINAAAIAQASANVAQAREQLAVASAINTVNAALVP